MKFDKWLDLKARQSQKPGCIDVTWRNDDIGFCEAFYEVNFKNASGSVLHTETGLQMKEIEKCGIGDRENVTEVELNIIHGGNINTFRTNVTIIELEGKLLISQNCQNLCSLLLLLIARFAVKLQVFGVGCIYICCEHRFRRQGAGGCSSPKFEKICKNQP